MTDSQNVPPDLFSKDCTFFSNQRLLDLKLAFLHGDGKIACKQDKTYGVGIFAAI